MYIDSFENRKPVEEYTSIRYWKELQLIDNMVEYPDFKRRLNLLTRSYELKLLDYIKR